MERYLQKCERCNHIWLPRKETKVIKVCPKCKSPYYDVKKTD